MVKRFEGTALPHVDQMEAYTDVRTDVMSYFVLSGRLANLPFNAFIHTPHTYTQWLDELLQRAEGKMRPV